MILVMIPTFNESENIAALIEKLLSLPLKDLEVLVVDDSSPDGTGEIVEKMARRNARVHLLARSGPPGRGLAGREGYLYGLKAGAQALIEMDADFSHDPRFVPDLIAAMASCDLAIGSRFAVGGTDLDRPLFRRLLTVAANLYARLVLGLPVVDTNSGFRCLSRRALAAVAPETLRSSGPSIVHEVLYRASRAGLRVAEVPIEFIDRKQGASKLTLARLAAGYFWILRMRLLGR